MNLLLEITLKSRLVEKLSLACYEGLFAVSDDDLKEDEHRSIACVHSFYRTCIFMLPRRRRCTGGICYVILH